MLFALVPVLATLLAAPPQQRFAPCPSLRQAAHLPLRPGGGILHGDLDGDGRRDRVTIHYSPRARVTCGFVLVVQIGHGAYSAVVPAAGKGVITTAAQHVRDYQEPALGSLVRIDRRKLTILVADSRGASTVEASPYRLSGRRLVRTYPGFVFYGSIASNHQVDCYGGAGSGIVAETVEWPFDASGKRWGFERTLLRSTGGVLRQISTRRLVVGEPKAEQLDRRWHLGDHPFRSCTVAGGF